MSYLSHIKDCNNCQLANFRPFYVDGIRVGHLKHDFAERLKSWPTVFQVSPQAVRLDPHLCSLAARTQAMRTVVEILVEQGVIPHWHGESYPVTGTSKAQVLFTLDRGAASYFGVRAFGQHLNGVVNDNGQLKMWIGRRSRSKWSDSGKLDNMIAGGLPYGISLSENLIKEGWEEAAIPPDLCAQAIPVGYISYCMETPLGLKPDIMYCYDLELPADVIPQCQDGEVEEFYLWPVEKVAALVQDTEEFKKNCNLVIIDFLIRRGFIPPDHPDYLEMVAGLRVPL
ncbi:DUF4743 domain-containing protein [Candidatus Nitrosoglobus terrae]|nr:DUF4743 domain-containing protein [Candidatus Nitrosoglobus terrae]